MSFPPNLALPTTLSGLNPPSSKSGIFPGSTILKTWSVLVKGLSLSATVIFATPSKLTFSPFPVKASLNAPAPAKLRLVAIV